MLLLVSPQALEMKLATMTSCLWALMLAEGAETSWRLRARWAEARACRGKAKS